MKARKLILVIADVLLLAVCIFQGVKSAKKTIKNFDISEEPDELIVQLPEMTFSIINENGSWIVGDKKYPANQSSVQSLIDTVSSVKAIDRVAKASGDEVLNRYELSEGKKVTVTVKKEGKILRTLNIGKDSATGTQGYVCFDDNKDVYLVAANMNYLCSKTPEDLRSRAVLELDKASVIAVTVSPAEGEGWSVTAAGDGENKSWSFSNAELELDADKVTEWTGDLCYLAAAKWYDEAAVLHGSKLTSVAINCGSKTEILDIFAVYNEDGTIGSYYGKCTSTPYPFEIAAYSVNKYLKNYSELTK